MSHAWIKDNLAISWYSEGGWKREPLSENTDGTIQVLTKDQALIHVDVRLENESTMNGRKVYTVEATISANEDGVAAGMMLHMAVDASLECTWKPHLAPMDNMTIGDRAFHSPAIVLENEEKRLALIPDLKSIQANRTLPHMMDYVIDDHEIYYGLSAYKETGHVYYELTPKAEQIEESLTFRFYLVEWEKQSDEVKRDYRTVEQFLWEKFAGETMVLAESPEETIASLQKYPQYAYEWALDRWSDVCWQEFKIDGRDVGGVVFIVTAKQKPGSGNEEEWREPKSLWNQAWFSSLRTAYGYWKGGHEHERADWIKKAELALEFALSAPQINGLFPGYYEAGSDNTWESGQWMMSGPRRPAGHEGYVHLLDSSWTCYWLLKWYRDLQQDERILTYVRKYVEQLVLLQREDGGFPAWVDPNTLQSSEYLAISPEASIHTMLLCLLREVDGQSDYIMQAEKAASFVQENIVLEGRWEDFETYWSCSKQWEGKQYGVKDARSGLYNQCSFGMYWTAEAFKSLYEATGRVAWLEKGERLLAEISLYQQIWEPHYFPVPTLGGFGVMTSDDEWNDARQSLFALTYYDYYRLTGNKTYLARSMWAMKASFYMMYCPENPEVMALYNQVHPHLDEQDYGFHMENFNHHDGTSVNGLGEFTIFDWGCGAASTSYAVLKDKVMG